MSKTKLLIAAILGLVTGLWEVMATPFLPGWLAARPFLPLVVLLLIASGRSRAYVAALAGGMVLDVYAFGSFDLATVRLLATVFFLDVLFLHFLTNRSLYAALGLVLIGRLFERLTSWIVGNVAWWLGRSPYDWTNVPHAWVSLGWDLAIVGCGFLLIALITKRFSTLMQRPQNISSDLYEF